MVVSLPSLLAGSGRRPCRLLVPLQVPVWLVRVGTCLCCAALSVPLAAVAAPVVPSDAVSRLWPLRGVVRRPFLWQAFAPRRVQVVSLVLFGTIVLPLGLSLFELHPTGFGTLVDP